MEIKVYMHRTKKHQFEVADAFVVDLDFSKLDEDKKQDVDFINAGFKNDCQKIAHTKNCIKKYGTGYISFMRPQYEGPEDKNGSEYVYFDNQEMVFKLRKEEK